MGLFGSGDFHKRMLVSYTHKPNFTQSNVCLCINNRVKNIAVLLTIDVNAVDRFLNSCLEAGKEVSIFVWYVVCRLRPRAIVIKPVNLCISLMRSSIEVVALIIDLLSFLATHLIYPPYL